MRTSEEIHELAAALSAAQGAFENPDRNRTVKVATRSGSSYSFSYATLDAIVAMIRTPLAANSLAVVQAVATHSVEGQGVTVTVTTRLLHSSGEWIETDMSATSSGELQAIGSCVSYLRRYSLVALLGIASEEDDDGNVAAGNQVQVRDRKPKLSPDEEAYITDATAQILTASKDQLVAMAEIIRTKSANIREALKTPYSTRMAVLKTTEEVP